VLEAILPKLHLNRHTPRAVLFAGPQYGGLSLLETYTDLGHGHLSYFIGHLKLGDDVGNLIRTLITHTQLQTGSATQFFKLSYPEYSKWIDSTWITDIWKITHQARLVIEVEDHWLPWLSRQHDVALMDFALSLNLNPHQLTCINTYRLHLQVTTLSDITTAAGDMIAPCILAGTRDAHCPSIFQWAVIPCPLPLVFGANGSSFFSTSQLGGVYLVRSVLGLLHLLTHGSGIRISWASFGNTGYPMISG
jgi:hypothetical protein